MFQYIILPLIAISAVISEGNSCVCKNPNDWENVKPCYEVFKELSRALTNDRGNLYRMKQAFFYAPSADPVLIKVKYNISYGENVTKDQLHYCENVDNNTIAAITAITINQTEIIRGWTSRGVYYVINPLLLSKMQMVLPFAILRLINSILGPASGSPEVDTFLWDGSYELPTLLINLHITSLPCIPTEEVFNCTLEELNAYLKTYAKSQDLTKSTAVHADDIAYTLSEDRMLHPFDNQTDITYAIFMYNSFGFVMVLGSLILAREKLKSMFREHIALVMSAMFVGFLLVVSESLAIIIHSIKRRDSLYILCHAFVLFSMPLIFIYTAYVYICTRVTKKYKEKIKLVAIFLVCLVCLFLIHIYCYALPTFLFLLLYPTKTITVVAYLITFVFAASVTFSISTRLTIWRYHRVSRRKKIIVMFICGIYLLVFPVIMFAIVINLLYPLVLGEASAISAGPYTVLSLIPTAVVSALTWLIKNKVFSHKIEDEEQPATDDDGGVNEATPIN